MKMIRPFYLVLLVTFSLSGCDEHGDPQGKIELNAQQAASVSMRGRWGSASDASLPFGTTPGVLDGLVLEFRIDDNYSPSSFSAVGAPYFFLGDNGTWSWGDEEFTEISLQNILPVTGIHILKEGFAIRLTFEYQEPEGGRTKKTGEYGITLKKIAP